MVQSRPRAGPLKLGVLTTSWPCGARPWSGHFVADLAAGLAARGHEVDVIALRWRDEALLGRPDVRVHGADLGVPVRSLGAMSGLWPLALGALRAAAGEVHARSGSRTWMANWWPSALAAPPHAPCVAILHGSDVDLAERWPPALVGGLTQRIIGAIGVADHLADRFTRRAGVPALGVCPLGARVATGGEGGISERGTSSSAAVRRLAPLASWAGDPRPRVLTVARDAPGKGLEVARAAARQLQEVAWAVVTPEDGLGPAEIRVLLRSADALVVPGSVGMGLPTEGRPHVITQALVAGVPVVGGPNPVIRQALREAGQCEVDYAGPDALASAVLEAVSEPYRTRLRASARRAGRSYAWSAVLPGWEQALGAAGR